MSGPTRHDRGLDAAARAIAACDPLSPPLDELPESRQQTIRFQAAAAVAAYTEATLLAGRVDCSHGTRLFLEGAAKLVALDPEEAPGLYEHGGSLASPARLPGDAAGAP